MWRAKRMVDLVNEQLKCEIPGNAVTNESNYETVVQSNNVAATAVKSVPNSAVNSDTMGIYNNNAQDSVIIGANVTVGTTSDSDIDQDDSDVDKNFVPTSCSSSEESEEDVEVCKHKQRRLVTSNRLPTPIDVGLPDMTAHSVNNAITAPECINSESGEGLQNTDVSQRSKKRSYNRLEMKEKKMRGEEYFTRGGVLKPAKVIVSLTNCCRQDCYKRLPGDGQRLLFEQFHKNVVDKDQALCDRMTIAGINQERKGRGQTGEHKNRQIVVSYRVTYNGEDVKVCKKMFEHIHGISRGKVDMLIVKKRSSSTGFVQPSSSGRHTPHNARPEEREKAIKHIESFPKYQSHYSRSHTSKLYLAPNLNIRKMYGLYQDRSITATPISYPVYAKLFRGLGYKFKCPSIDTCKTCDHLQNTIKSAKCDEERMKLVDEKDLHLKLADDAYKQKRTDIEMAKQSRTEKVLVFDMQQNLPTPVLTTNVVYYKRQLWTYNLTVRNCTDNSTKCYMWHEGISDRGADQVASCLTKCIESLPNTTTKVTLYSDSCPGQNKNNIVAAALSFLVHNSPNIQVIEHKFLEVGHTRMECDADHARIERAKKSTSIELRIPHDWYQFVRTVPGKNKFEVIEMKKEDFIAYSSLFSSIFIKRNMTTEGNPTRWHDIKVLSYSKDLGIINIKYSHSTSEHCQLNIKRRGQRDPTLQPVHCGPRPIQAEKKKDLLDLLKYLDPVYHQFYKDLVTSAESSDTV